LPLDNINNLPVIGGEGQDILRNLSLVIRYNPLSSSTDNDRLMDDELYSLIYVFLKEKGLKELAHSLKKQKNVDRKASVTFGLVDLLSHWKDSKGKEKEISSSKPTSLPLKTSSNDNPLSSDSTKMKTSVVPKNLVSTTTTTSKIKTEPKSIIPKDVNSSSTTAANATISTTTNTTTTTTTTISGSDTDEALSPSLQTVLKSREGNKKDHNLSSNGGKGFVTSRKGDFETILVTKNKKKSELQPQSVDSKVIALSTNSVNEVIDNSKKSINKKRKNMDEVDVTEKEGKVLEPPVLKKQKKSVTIMSPVEEVNNDDPIISAKKVKGLEKESADELISSRKASMSKSVRPPTPFTSSKKSLMTSANSKTPDSKQEQTYNREINFDEEDVIDGRNDDVDVEDMSNKNELEQVASNGFEVMATMDQNHIKLKPKSSNSGAGNTPFKRVTADDVRFADNSLMDNTYESNILKHSTVGIDYGLKANMDLKDKRGKKFRQGKTKKKKSGYRGGEIDINAVRSFKFA